MRRKEGVRLNLFDITLAETVEVLSVRPVLSTLSVYFHTLGESYGTKHPCLRFIASTLRLISSASHLAPHGNNRKLFLVILLVSLQGPVLFDTHRHT